MSDAGLRVYNKNGISQIDSNYRNFSYRSKGSVTCSGNAGGATALKWASITVNSVSVPMVAIDPGSEVICLWRVSVSGSTWTFYYLGPNGATFDYWVFEYFQPLPLSPGDVGLEVYDPAGNVVYNTGAAPMRIAGTKSAGTNTGLPSGRDYAGIQSAVGFSETYSSLLGTITYRARLAGISKPTATGLLTFNSIFEQYTVGAAGTDIADPSPDLFVVDVTHL